MVYQLVEIHEHLIVVWFVVTFTT